MPVTRLLVGLIALACLDSIQAWGGPDNIAPQAEVTASSQYSDAYAAGQVRDGVMRMADQGEWACQGQTTWWGLISYPWIKLSWSREQVIDRVVLYDRPAQAEHTAGGVLEFSDGSQIRVFAIPNDGSPKQLCFSPKRIEWLRFKVTDGLGVNLGLSEIEVFPHSADESDYVGWVDPSIETNRGRWFFCTPGSRPFGLVAAAPYTRNKNQWGGGYNYNSTEILGFSQIHAWIMSGINLMPTTGTVDPTQGEQAWKSAFSHASEIIQPGYQRIYLDRYHSWVEMTCTDRVSLYRLTYTQDALARVLVSLGGWIGSVSMVEARVRQVGAQRLEGSVGTTDRLWGGPKLTRIFFVVEFDRPLDSLDGWQGQERLSNISELAMPSVTQERLSNNRKHLFKSLPEEAAGVSGAYAVQAGEQVQVKIAVSYTSIDNARRNLQAECPHWDFERVRAEARAQWNQWLGRIQVKGGTHAQRTKFYTDLWHVLLGRHKLDDVSGDYPVYMDEEPTRRSSAGLLVKTIPKTDRGRPQFHMYNFDALWLTMWNLNVLWGLAWPAQLDDFSACLVQYAENGGWLPRGPSAGGYTGIMTGCPATSLISSTYQKGLLSKVNPEHAYAHMKRNHMPGGIMGVNQAYLDQGWSPNGAGVTLQWAFEDWALAQMARKLGRDQDAQYFATRASGWPALYHAGQGLIFPKQADGAWMHTNPLSGRGWVEANAWQGSWSVSHDIKQLAALMGGPERLAEKLNYAFEQAAATDFVFAYGGGYVSYANQPGCSNAHVFNHVGHPWLSQYWVRRVNEQAYGGTTPDVGYGGHDEDQGQMGGVSALMSLGLFSLRGTCAMRPIYEITSPVFDQVTIQLDPDYYPGRTFSIKTYDNSGENCYIQRARLNSRELNTCWLYHQDFAQGGVLELWLGPQPNQAWGQGP